MTIHTYWVVDPMIKSHRYPQEVKAILDHYINFYDRWTPFETVEERNSCIPQALSSSMMNAYGNLDIFRTLPIDYIAPVIELFSLCEKRNENAYMFRNILHLPKDYVDGTADCMKAIKASMPLSR